MAIPGLRNLLRGEPSDSAEELVETLVRWPGGGVERIVSRGQTSPEGFWYDQATAEGVLVLSGAARLQFAEGAELSLGPGDWLVIPAHVRHRVAWTTPDEPTVWLAVHFSPGMPVESTRWPVRE